MPKIKHSIHSRLQQYVAEFSGMFTSNGKTLFCQKCGKSVNADQRSQVLQHLAGSKHKIAASRATSTRQVLLGETASSSHTPVSKSSEYYADLCKAFLSSDIPLYKLKSPELRTFLTKYTNFETPAESTLRKLYVPACYEQMLGKIRAECENKKIWVSMDESPDSSGRKVGNVVVGALENNEIVSKRCFLLACREISASNHVTMARLFNESLQLLWPIGVKFDNVLLLLTDAAPYMKKAAEGLSVSFPNMIHVTCIVHGLHRVCEQVRALYPEVDKLISNGKKVFVKAPTRIDLFKAKNPDLALPPRPIVTRWGTWLEAVVYYADNFENIKSVIDELNKDDASSIEILQNLLKDSTLQNKLSYISANLSFLCLSIKKLETSTNLLTVTINEVHDIEKKINALQGPKVEAIKQKFKSVFAKNDGFNTMCKIAKVLQGQVDIGEIENLHVSDIPLMKYARLSSCDVERSFSRYRALFRDNRHRFVMENLEKVFIVHCNSEFFQPSSVST